VDSVHFEGRANRISDTLDPEYERKRIWALSKWKEELA
jgi:hypothetical protein